MDGRLCSAQYRVHPNFAPNFIGRVARALILVECARYQTEECSNVALGHVIEALDKAFDSIRQRGPVIEFVRRQLGNRRTGVSRIAEHFLTRHQQDLGGAR